MRYSDTATLNLELGFACSLGCRGYSGSDVYVFENIRNNLVPSLRHYVVVADSRPVIDYSNL